MGDLVIGDISGYKKEFEKLIQGFAGRIIALGDIIDRGPESRQMIEFFMNHPEHLTLMGNHEHMMIKTYEEVMDNKKSPYFSLIWIYVNGGKETLESYGITVPSPPFDLNEMFRMNKQLRPC
jgi:serine/threonine protein phosphatase 1